MPRALFVAAGITHHEVFARSDARRDQRTRGEVPGVGRGLGVCDALAFEVRQRGDIVGICLEPARR